MNEIDTWLLLQINGMHNEFWDTFMYTFSEKLVWVPLYLSLFFVLWRNMNPRAALLCLLAIGLTILFADQVCSHLIRPVVERWRPSRLENPVSEWVHIVNGYRGGKYGFPSCHAANTAALAMFFHLLFRKRAITLPLALWASVTCYSRAYLGVHYPGDLLAGVVVGMAGAWLMAGLFARVAHYRPTEPVRHSWLVAVCMGGLTLGFLLYSCF